MLHRRTLHGFRTFLDDRCPNCGKQGENNRHLNRCMDPGRIQLFRDGVRKLGLWIRYFPQTDPELAFWVTEYPLHRGQVRMANLVMLRLMSAALMEAAKSQDMIKWIKFLHGRLSIKFCQIQVS